MNVLSLFDGISCARIALERANIKVDKYYASEIDKYCIKVTQHNYPDTIQVGDVTKLKGSDLPEIDLLIGGSPCQGFSQCGKRLNFDDPRSKLFFEYVRLLDECEPEYFLLENVRMKKEWQDIITSYLGIEPVEINSALVSAQNRVRLYWTNIKTKPVGLFWKLEPDIPQPKDRGILLKDILLNDVGEEYWLSQKARLLMDRELPDGRTNWDLKFHGDSEDDKSHCVKSNYYKGVPNNALIDRRNASCSFWDCDFQDHKEMCKECFERDSYQGEQYPTSIVRYFTPEECERLQTIPDNYTSILSKTQRYKTIGNAFTVEVIAHILFFIRIKEFPHAH